VRRTSIAFKAVLLLAAIIMAGVLGRPLPWVSVDRANAVTRTMVTQVPPSARAAGHGGLGTAFSGSVEARGVNALHAKQQLDGWITSMSRLAESEGGRVTLGETRYLRSKEAGAGPRRSAEIWIIQHVDIELPDAADHRRLEAELARISFVPHG
jgi:hypothetical protein